MYCPTWEPNVCSVPSCFPITRLCLTAAYCDSLKDLHVVSRMLDTKFLEILKGPQPPFPLSSMSWKVAQFQVLYMSPWEIEVWV